jgi:hypothetical protein
MVVYVQITPPEGGEHNQTFEVGEKQPGIGVPFLVQTPGT